MSTNLRDLLVRFGLALLVGLVFGWLVSQVTFATMRDATDRPPKRIELVIPAGTAEKVAAGQASITLPETMVFVEGDTLVVKNEDVVSHQLGPIWVPVGASGVMNLTQAEQYSLACTFQPKRFLGLDVRPQVTDDIRIQAVIAVGLPSGVMLGLFSLAVVPLGSRKMSKD